MLSFTLQRYLGGSEFRNGIGKSLDGPLERSQGTKLYDSYRADRNRNFLNPHALKPAAADLSLSPPIDRRLLGEFRSQSAAPSLQSLGPPPGLEKADRLRPQNAIADSYLDSDDSNLLMLGQRRAASTGVLGNPRPQKASQSVRFGAMEGGSGAVRPAAKTLMDLIKEDFEADSPDRGYEDNNYGHRGHGDFREDRQQVRSKMYNRYPEDDQPRYSNGDSRYNNGDRRYHDAHNDMGSNGSDNFDEDHLAMRRGGPRNGYDTMVSF